MRQQNSEETDDAIKRCPKCGAAIVLRSYSESYEDYEICPISGRQSEVACNSQDMGETDRKHYCTRCGWELWQGEAKDEDSYVPTPLQETENHPLDTFGQAEDYVTSAYWVRRVEIDDENEEAKFHQRFYEAEQGENGLVHYEYR
jgi:hypothetical protein